MIAEVEAEANEMHLREVGEWAGGEFGGGWAWDEVKNKPLDPSKFRVKGEKDVEDTATPPLELSRTMIYETVTVTRDGGWRKLLFVDFEKSQPDE
jgi:hypothetical protein